MTPQEMAESGRIADELRVHYLDARVLPDGSVACLQDLFTTRALLLGCTHDGWERRFCFADVSLADRRFDELTSEDDVPTGFIARRGRP